MEHLSKYNNTYVAFILSRTGWVDHVFLYKLIAKKIKWNQCHSIQPSGLGMTQLTTKFGFCIVNWADPDNQTYVSVPFVLDHDRFSPKYLP